MLSAAVSFLVTAVILRASRKRDLAAEAAGENTLEDAIAKNAANKGGSSRVGDLISTTGANSPQADAEVAGGGVATATKISRSSSPATPAWDRVPWAQRWCETS